MEERVYRNIAPRPMVIPAVHTDEGRDDQGAGGYISVYGLLPTSAPPKIHDHHHIFKYPVHVLKTERSVALRYYFETLSFAHVVKTELSAGTGPRGGWA